MRPTCLSISWIRWLVKCFPSCWWSMFTILLQLSNCRLKKKICRSQICWWLGKVSVFKQTFVDSAIAFFSINERLSTILSHSFTTNCSILNDLNCVSPIFFHCKLSSSQFTWVMRQLFCLKRVFPERDASASGFPRRLASHKVRVEDEGSN